MRVGLWLAMSWLLMLGGCSVGKWRALLPPQWSGMRPVATSAGLSGIFVDAAMTPKQLYALRVAAIEARRRVALVWGDITTAPTLFACASEACFRRLGGSSNSAHSLGDHRIVLSPRALDAGTLAHEWSHAEMYRRSGGLLALPAVPRWFDEGIAVLVSREPRHGDAVWRKVAASGLAPPLASLWSHVQWLDAVRRYRDPLRNPRNLAVVYATAGHYVARWYRHAGRAGLLRVVRAIREGGDFASAWRAAGLDGAPVRQAAAVRRSCPCVRAASPGSSPRGSVRPGHGRSVPGRL